MDGLHQRSNKVVYKFVLMIHSLIMIHILVLICAQTANSETFTPKSVHHNAILTILSIKTILLICVLSSVQIIQVCMLKIQPDNVF